MLNSAGLEAEREADAAAWCTDRLAGAEELGGVGERPFLALGAHRAVQAQPGPPPPHPSTAAQGHELAGLRRQLTAARQPDGVVHRGGGRRVGGRTPHDPGRAALVLAPCMGIVVSSWFSGLPFL